MTTKTETTATTATTTKKPRGKKTTTATTATTATGRVTTLTNGERAEHVTGAKLTALLTRYPFITPFLSTTGYNAVREISVFISSEFTTATGTKYRVPDFFTFNGNNKTKKITPPADRVLSIDAAIKRFPDLKPIAALKNPTLYITIGSNISPRFHISFKN